MILNLVRYCKITGSNTIRIYKAPWNFESKYGNDIDLFIENDSGKFNWYALQAKVMSYNSVYKDLKFDTKKPQQQWNKLLSHETTFGSKTYYLLYNGKPKINIPTTSPTRFDCIGIPKIEELGLGIVETQIIRNIRETQLTKTQQFFFKYVFPNHIDSFRKLFCCSKLPKTRKQFNLNEIDLSGYKKIYSNNSNKNEFETDELKKNTLKDGSAPIRLIIKKE